MLVKHVWNLLLHFLIFSQLRKLHGVVVRFINLSEFIHK